MKRKITSFVLSIVLCLSLLPAVTLTASAENVWDGTEDTSWHDDSPTNFTIYTAAQLAGLRSLVSKGTDFSGKTITLGDDLDLDDRVWTPIGDYSHYFTGTFDGGDHTIKGLKVTPNSNYDYAGLFYKIGTGAIKRLNVSGEVTGSKSAGGVVGLTGDKATVTNCSFSGTVTGSGYVGGIVGQNSSSMVSNCHNSGTVVNNNSSSMNIGAGGVVGFSSTVTGQAVQYCYNTGEVRGFGPTGGVVGNNYAGTVEFCYNTGEVTVTSAHYAGGVVGQTGGAVTQCYNIGQVSTDGDGDPAKLGGVAGSTSSPNWVEACFYLSGTAEKGIASGTGDEKALYACEFASQDSFVSPSRVDWCFVGDPYGMIIWKMGEANGAPVRPILLAYPETGNTLVKLECTCKLGGDDKCTGCGTENCSCQSAAPAEHNISIDTTANGSVTASTDSAAAGATVTLTVTPDTGYKLKSLTVTSEAGETLEASPVEDSTTEYAFTMPDSDVTVTAEFEHIHVWNTWNYNDTHHWYECGGEGGCDIAADADKNGYGPHSIDGWQSDGNEHWRGCGTCGWTDVKTAHDWNDGVETIPPTTESTGVITYTCSTCQATKEETIPKLTPGHTHAWNSWNYNDTHHWHECGGEGGCGITANSDKDGYAAHTKTWVNTDETQHWQTCGVCGWTGTKAAHVWDDGKVTTPPTAGTEGVKTFTCADCGAARTESVAKPGHTHAWAAAWEKNEIYHWHECEGAGICDITANSGKNGYGRHSTDWQTTKTGHSQWCRVCGWTSVEAAHIWDDGRAEANSRIYTCTICGVTREERAFTVSGYAYEKQNNSNDNTKRVKDATVQLMRGNVPYGDGTTTDNEGKFSFTNVKPGVYSIVAADKNGKFSVTMPLVIDGSVTGDIYIELEIPNNKTKTKVVAKDTGGSESAAAPVVAVDGLNDQADIIAAEAVAQGGQDVTVSVTMTVEAVAAKADTDAEIASDIEAIEEAAAETAQTLEFLAIAVEKQVNDEEPEPIKQTESLLTIMINFDMTDKENMIVYRKHGPEVSRLAEVPDKDAGEKNDGTFWLDKENGFIYIYTQKFSTYAIGYTEKADDNRGFTVIFDSNGGSEIGKTIVVKGRPVTKPEDPVRDHHSFVGWYADAGCTIPWDFADPVTGNMTLFANWTKNDDPPGGDDGSSGGGNGGNPAGDTKKPSSTDKPGAGAVASRPTTTGGGSSGTGGGYGGSSSSAMGGGKSAGSTGSTLVPVPSGGSTGAVGGFTDVPYGHSFASEIAWAQSNGILGGYGDGSFRPSANTTRQALWMVLARMSGTYPANMAEARAWSINAGISDGTNGEGNMSRQQFITMLYRYAQVQGLAVSGSAELGGFSDSGIVANYAQEALAWGVANGIITGTTDGRLNPEGTATRAHFAAFVYRFANLNLTPASAGTTADVG